MIRIDAHHAMDRLKEIRVRCDECSYDRAITAWDGDFQEMLNKILVSNKRCSHV